MWNRKQWIIWFFGIFAVCGTVVEIIAIAPNKRLPIPPGLRGCISSGGKDYIWIYWVPPLLYDTTATVFMLIPLIRHWRTSGRTPLLTLFLRDGILYFLVVFICNFVNVIYFNIPNVTNQALNAPLAVAFTTMMASRIVLNLRSPSANIGSGDGGGSSHGGGVGGGTGKMFTKSGNHFKPGVGGEPEVHLQSLGRQTTDLEKAYHHPAFDRLNMSNPAVMGGRGVVVNIETVTNVEKGNDLDRSEEEERHGY
ncbi:hypothetical protein BT69DRAFT_443357 [Atractiella rhizophila]|nr:hypothetical protein BT69DRAFT_443357 [Atractiella rhizophila]